MDSTEEYACGFCQDLGLPNVERAVKVVAGQTFMAFLINGSQATQACDYMPYQPAYTVPLLAPSPKDSTADKSKVIA